MAPQPHRSVLYDLFDNGIYRCPCSIQAAEETDRLPLVRDGASQRLVLRAHGEQLFHGGSLIPRERHSLRNCRNPTTFVPPDDRPSIESPNLARLRSKISPRRMILFTGRRLRIVSMTA